MKFIGKIGDVSLSLSGEIRIAVETKDKTVLDLLDDLREKDLTVEIKPFFKKRSLNANAYLWVLLGELSAKLRVSPDEIYKECIRDVGGNYTVVCVREKDKEKVIKGWSSSGLGWIAEEFGSQISGCVNLRLFYGSSTYDTAQMSRLLDIVIEDCKAQGIQTETPEEIQKMLARME